MLQGKATFKVRVEVLRCFKVVFCSLLMNSPPSVGRDCGFPRKTQGGIEVFTQQLSGWC